MKYRVDYVAREMREEISRKRRWYSGEGNCGVVRVREQRVGMLVLKFSRQPTEKTLDGSRLGETPGNRH